MTEIPPLVHVVGVTVIGDHELRLLFEDGTVGDIAFGDDEWRGVFAPLSDPELFAQVRVDPQTGTIVWPGDLDMALEALYLQAGAPSCGAGARLITEPIRGKRARPGIARP